MFNEYKRRDFSEDYSPFVLNIEELATIYHFPGGVAQTPNFLQDYYQRKLKRRLIYLLNMSDALC